VTEIMTVMEKGRITMPDSMASLEVFTTGNQVVIFSDGRNVVITPLIKPAVGSNDAETFEAVCTEARRYAAETGMTGEDITAAIRAVRREGNS